MNAFVFPTLGEIYIMTAAILCKEKKKIAEENKNVNKYIRVCLDK